MNDYKISVVMSTYNESCNLIDKSVNSILNQTVDFYEFIIVNDNPARIDLKMYLESIKKKDSRIIIIENSSNLGLISSLNIGVNRARGNVIARMDADDISLPFRFEMQLAWLKKNDLDLVGCCITCIGEDEKKISDYYFPLNHKKISKYLLWGSCIAHPTWFGKKIVFDNLGGYNNVETCEDYDFLIRAAKAGFKLGNISQVGLLYRIRKDGISCSNLVKQNLISYFLSRSFRKGKECCPESIHVYLCSDDYKNDYRRLKKYEDIKYKFLYSESLIVRGNCLLLFLFNTFFYKNILKKIMYWLYS